MRLYSLFVALVLLTPTLSAELWTLSTVDEAGDTGQYAAIGSRYGQTHVAFYDATNGDLKYAVTTDDKQWKIETVDSTGDVGQWAAIFIDIKGYPHISYFDATNSDLKYAAKLAGSWKTDVVDSANAGQYTSIAVNDEHLIYISYLSMTGWNLKVVKGEPGNWVTALTDLTNIVGLGTSIAIDKKGCAHVSYTDYTAASLKYATDCDGSFAVYTLDPVNVGVPTAIALDGLGVIHIAYYSGGLRYMTNATGDWVSEPVDSAIGIEQYDLSIAASDDGQPFITYHDDYFSHLKLARRGEGSTWTITDIDKGGQFNAIVLDGKQIIRIAYFNAGDQDLRYAIND